MEKDIILVGSGLSACTLAWKLHQRNISFVWYADNAPAASNAAYGILNPIHFRNVAKGWKDDFFFDAAYNFYLEINEITNVNITTKTKIFHFLNDAKEGVLYRQQSECGDLGNYCDGETHQLNDIAINSSELGGVIIKKALHVQIPTYVKSTLSFFQDNIVQEHFDAQKLIVGSVLQYEKIVAKNIIFCEGKYIENNPFFSYVPLNLSKGEVIQIKTEEKLPNFALHKKVFILHQSNDEYIVGATTAWGDSTNDNTNAAKEELTAAANAILRTKFEIIEQRNGIRPAMADRRPILGSHPKFHQILVLNGMGSKGLFFAPKSADLLLDNLYQNTEISFDISIRRFDRRYRTWAEEQQKKAPKN